MSREQSDRHPPYQAIKLWFGRHEQTLLILNCVSLVLLFLLHIFSTNVPIFVPAIADFVNIIAIILVSFIFVSVVCKGLVPVIICILGVVLLHNAAILPYFTQTETRSSTPDYMFSKIDIAKGSAQLPSSMHFFLGLGMVVMAVIFGYRPGFLFARNRPQSEEERENNDIWSKYPIWQDNIRLASGYHHKEELAPAKSLMEDKDRYLTWRYEYVLAYIYGEAHLVKPDGFVPKNDTCFIRDKESGLLIGKARYTGYFT